jgi:hypothetical protein
MRGRRKQPLQTEWFFDIFTGPRGPLTRKQKLQRLRRAAGHTLIILLFIGVVVAAGGYGMYLNGWRVNLK